MSQLQNSPPRKIVLLTPLALAAARLLSQVCPRRRQPNPLAGSGKGSSKSSIFHVRGVLQLAPMFLLFFLFLVPFSLFSEHYYAAICAMFKNEAPWMREWIEYHRLLGFEHFYLYNNESEDGTVEVLRPYVEQGLVEIIPWENTPEHWDTRGINWDGYQRKAYNDCISRTVGVVEWVAMIDIDEYIVPVKSKESFWTLLDKVKKYKNEKSKRHNMIGSLKIPWVWYGTSGVWEIPPGKLLTESLYMRASKDFYWHFYHKSIYRPEAVSDCGIHDAELKKGYCAKKVPPGHIRTNHYWARDEKSFLKKRCGLYLNSPDELKTAVTPERFQEIRSQLDELNQVRDTAIFPYLPALRKALKQPH